MLKLTGKFKGSSDLANVEEQMRQTELAINALDVRAPLRVKSHYHQKLSRLRELRAQIVTEIVGADKLRALEASIERCTNEGDDDDENA